LIALSEQGIVILMVDEKMEPDVGKNIGSISNQYHTNLSMSYQYHTNLSMAYQYHTNLSISYQYRTNLSISNQCISISQYHTNINTNLSISYQSLSEQGIVILMVDEKMEPDVAKNMVKGDSDPLNSSFHLGYLFFLFYRGTLLIGNLTPPWDHHRALGKVLLQGPKGALFLTREVPLYV
jgi:hypothetical protein